MQIRFIKGLVLLLCILLPNIGNTGVMDIAEDDYCMGNRDAKIIIVEYFSLTCPHCAEIHSGKDAIFEKLKEKYIDKGIVLYVSRQFPTNLPSLKAAMLTYCKADKYFDFVKALLTSQSIWAFFSDYEKRMLNVAKLAGINEDDLLTCLKNEELERKIIDAMYKTNNELQIDRTPMMFINGQVVDNIFDFKEIELRIKQCIMDSKLEDVQ